MNKSLIIAILLGSIQTAYAQAVIKAGTAQLGGSVGYFQAKTEAPYSFNAGYGETITTQHTDSKTFNVTPSAGYFVVDNLAIGILAGYGQSTTTSSYDAYSSGNNSQKNKAFNIGGFAKYYRMFSDQFGLAGSLGASYFHSASGYTNSYSSNSEVTFTGGEATLTPSIVFFPVRTFAIGASIGSLRYARGKNTLGSRTINGYPSPYADNELTSTSFGASFGLDQLAFSGTYYFGR